MTAGFGSIFSGQGVGGAIRGKVRRLLGRPVQTSQVLDLRGTSISPLDAVYQAGSRSALIEVPVAICRTFQHAGLPLDLGGAHPFVRTLLAVAGGSCRGYEGSPLQDYFTTFAPRSAADALGLSMAEASATLRALSPLAAVLPWWPTEGCTSIARRADAVRRTAEGELRRAGYQGTGPFSMYWQGPYPDEMGRIEFRRLLALADTIAARGYERSDAADRDIRGTLLLRPDGAARISLNGGEHRAAVLAALGSSHLPVRLTSQLAATVIRREDVDAWPYVVSGLFSRSAALSVFDRIFDGIAPWITPEVVQPIPLRLPEQAARASA